MARYDSEGDAYTNVASIAIGLFLSNGYEKTTMRMIQKETGMHSGSIYYLFKGKEDILSTVTEAFYGDVLCRSARICRAMCDRRLMAILPGAFIIDVSCRSDCLARLLYEAHGCRTVQNLMASMASEWMLRDGPDVDEDSIGRDMLFVQGGVGNLLGDLRFGDRAEGRTYVARIIDFMYPLIGTADDGCVLLDTVMRSMESEHIEFFGLDPDDIDEEYGDDTDG